MLCLRYTIVLGGANIKKKIFVDFDDTLVDSTSTIVEVYNRLYGEEADVRNIRAFDLLDQCPRIGELTGDYQKELTGMYACEDFWQNLQPKPHAVEIMNKFKAEGFELILVSYGDAPNLAKKIYYAHEHFSMLDGYILLSQHHKPFTKRDVNMQDCFFIDDYASYLIESNAKVKVMFGKELKGNRNPGFYNTGNWEDVYRYVHQVYEANKDVTVLPVASLALAAE